MSKLGALGIPVRSWAGRPHPDTAPLAGTTRSRLGIRALPSEASGMSDAAWSPGDRWSTPGTAFSIKAIVASAPSIAGEILSRSDGSPSISIRSPNGSSSSRRRPDPLRMLERHAVPLRGTGHASLIHPDDQPGRDRLAAERGRTATNDWRKGVLDDRERNVESLADHGDGLGKPEVTSDATGYTRIVELSRPQSNSKPLQDRPAVRREVADSRGARAVDSTGASARSGRVEACP